MFLFTQHYNINAIEIYELKGLFTQMQFFCEENVLGVN